MVYNAAHMARANDLLSTFRLILVMLTLFAASLWLKMVLDPGLPAEKKFRADQRIDRIAPVVAFPQLAFELPVGLVAAPDDFSTGLPADSSTAAKRFPRFSENIFTPTLPPAGYGPWSTTAKAPPGTS